MKTPLGLGSIGLLVFLSLGCATDADRAQVFENSGQLLTAHVGEACVFDDENNATIGGYDCQDLSSRNSEGSWAPLGDGNEFAAAYCVKNSIL